jgi:hypothetical protein
MLRIIRESHKVRTSEAASEKSRIAMGKPISRAEGRSFPFLHNQTPKEFQKKTRNFGAFFSAKIVTAKRPRSPCIAP